MTVFFLLLTLYFYFRASQVVLVVKNPPANAGDIRDEGLIPGLERSPEVISWPLLYFIGSASKASKQSLRRVRLFVIPWTVVYQASLSMGFSRQEYWSGLLFPSPGNLPDPGIKPRSSALQADALPSEPPGKPTIGSEYWFKVFVVTAGNVWRPPSERKALNFITLIDKQQGPTI